MSKRVILAVAALVLILPTAGAIVRPAWATAVGLDIWNVPGLQQEARSSAIQYREMDAEGGEVLHRIAVKEELIMNLISGRATLAATAAQFTTLNVAYPAYMNVIRISYPGITDEEKMAQNVMDFSWGRLNCEPAWRKFGILVRLNAEFQSLSAEFAKTSTQ